MYVFSCHDNCQVARPQEKQEACKSTSCQHELNVDIIELVNNVLNKWLGNNCQFW